MHAYHYFLIEIHKYEVYDYKLNLITYASKKFALEVFSMNKSVDKCEIGSFKNVILFSIIPSECVAQDMILDN